MAARRDKALDTLRALRDLGVKSVKFNVSGAIAEAEFFGSAERASLELSAGIKEMVVRQGESGPLTGAALAFKDATERGATIEELNKLKAKLSKEDFDKLMYMASD